MILVIGGAFQGKKEYAIETLGVEEERILEHYEERIREQLGSGLDLIESFRKLLKDRPDIVILCNEVGLGIVPLEKVDRDFREAVGHTLQFAAKEAEAVYRVICGIGERIK